MRTPADTMRLSKITGALGASATLTIQIHLLGQMQISHANVVRDLCQCFLKPTASKLKTMHEYKSLHDDAGRYWRQCQMIQAAGTILVHSSCTPIESITRQFVHSSGCTWQYRTKEPLLD